MAPTQQTLYAELGLDLDLWWSERQLPDATRTKHVTGCIRISGPPDARQAPPGRPVRARVRDARLSPPVRRGGGNGNGWPPFAARSRGHRRRMTCFGSGRSPPNTDRDVLAVVLL